MRWIFYAIVLVLLVFGTIPPFGRSGSKLNMEPLTGRIAGALMASAILVWYLSQNETLFVGLLLAGVGMVVVSLVRGVTR